MNAEIALLLGISEGASRPVTRRRTVRNELEVDDDLERLARKIPAQAVEGSLGAHPRSRRSAVVLPEGPIRDVTPRRVLLKAPRLRCSV